MYFEDFSPGNGFETESRTLSLEDIVTFAKQWDPQPFHIDEAAAAASPYGGIIASGFHTLLTAFGLILESGFWREASMGSPGMEHVKWMQPVRPGDALRARGEVLSVRASNSRPDRGFAEIHYDILNQDDACVASFRATQILRRRAAQP